MPIAPRIANFNIVDLSTSIKYTEVAPGMAAMATIQPGQKQSLGHYYSLSEVSNDYDPGSYVYQAASNYFNNPNATVFFVITYPNSGTDQSQQSSTPAGDGDKGKGASVVQPDGSSKALSNPTDSSKQSSDTSTDPAVAALTKYYKCGAEYFTFEVTSRADQQTATDLSNLVEGQQSSVLFLDQPTPAIAKLSDFAWYQPLVSNKSTVLFSLPYSGDPANYQFVPAILSKYAGGNPASNLELTHDIPNVTPQDYYNFTDADFQVYQKARVITYCYRNNRPMLSSGNSASHYQVSNLITRDYLNTHIQSGITTLMLKQHDAGKDIKYDQGGVNKITSEIRLVLDGAVTDGYIKKPHVDSVNVNKVPETIKEEGILSGLAFDWSPNNNINDIKLRQIINVPLMGANA